MKKTIPSYSGSTPKKQSVPKPLSAGRILSKVGPGGTGPSAAAVNRKSPVVLTEQSIATSSVIQAASDPKIKELVMKQQQEESRRESSKRPRADGLTPTHHIEHPNSAPHHSHHGQQFWKHNSFEGTDSLNNTLNASLTTGLNDTVSDSEKAFGKYSTVSPDVHQQKHYQFLEQAGGATPGSATLDTVVVNADGAVPVRTHHDDDGVNSEITTETGYMMVHKVVPTYPTMDSAAHNQGQAPQQRFSPNSGGAGAAGSAGQSGSHMNMYMDMNSSLLHEHHHGANSSGVGVKSLQSSPATASMAQNHHSNLPVPPPLNLPTAAQPPLTGTAQTPTGHISAISTAPSMHASAYQEPMMLPDPRALSDQALQDAYVRFLLEMETRGLQSMNINVASLLAASAQGAAPNAAFSSSSSCMGAPSAHAVAPTSAPSPTMAFGSYSAEVDMINRSAAAQQRPPVSSQAHTAKPSPVTAHMGLAAGVAGVNPVDIRKNVKRSKSNGSEAAFYPSTMFPGAQPGTTPAAAGPSGPPSGRKTPNSPMLGRYSHAAEGGAISYAQYLQQFGEPEEFELKDAFGQARHPGSPSYHSPYSPSHLSSNAPAPTYYQTHGHLHTVPQQAHHAGATPTTITAGSATWAGNAATQPAHAASVNAATQNPNLSRSASRCNGVQPPMASDTRDELLELRPGLRTNCLSTLPPTYSQYMYAHNTSNGNNVQPTTGPASSNAPGNDEASTTSTSEPRRVDLKTPKFVRKFQGIGAGLLGLTAALRFSSAEEEAEYTASTAAAAAASGSKNRTGSSGARNGSHAAVHTGHTRDVNVHAGGRNDSSERDNTVDAVREAGGLDNLLLTGRAQYLRSGLQTDEHSAFSQGSMSAFSQPSLNSTRSNSKKTSKSRS